MLDFVNPALNNRSLSLEDETDQSTSKLNKHYTGSRTFKFPSRVNLYNPSVYCVHSIGLVGATRLTRSDFRLNLLFLKGQRYVINKGVGSPELLFYTDNIPEVYNVRPVIHDN